jgi:hypothetical protein
MDAIAALARGDRRGLALLLAHLVLVPLAYGLGSRRWGPR